ncbi:hypothetical protein BB560_004088 [Smittium megazygosporum]|uniref:Methyltransferase type 11 domain-containing protein n=1 Tax=Smittium megazygosporum TaxID=133381 RepID=A0A2T9ZA94_9FUNG|nr:hypothetical protein BB560_004088 [Smittium megazygosporum]
MSAFSSSEYNYSGYSRDRPVYNPQLIDFMLKYHNEINTNKTDTVVDVATGTGIVARLLDKSFKRVVATDISAKMLETAKLVKNDGVNIEYKQATGEDMSFLPDNSVDMITVGTGAHWFNSEVFLKEANRVLVENGTLAIFGYSGYQEFVEYPQCNRIYTEFVEDVVGPYWEKGRHVLNRMYSHYNHLEREAGFKDVFFGIYPESATVYAGTGYTIMDKPYVIDHKLTWSGLENYFKTWSGVLNYNKAHPGKKDIAEITAARLTKAAGVTDRKTAIKLRWGQSVVMCRAVARLLL